MSSQIKKTLYVDLSNLYGGVAELLNPGDYFDFSTILPLIDKEFGGISTIKVYGAYMGSAGVTNAKELLFIKAQNEFFNSAKLNGVHFGKGNISRYGQEKGVDMQLGVDMVDDAHNRLYDDAIILTGDSDFAYPVSKAKSLGKNLHYCSFATRYSNYLAHQAWRKVVLDYNDYFANKFFPTIKSPPKTLKICKIDSSVKIKSA